jgi:tRNA (guanine37-N1)-methyltransferase
VSKVSVLRRGSDSAGIDIGRIRRGTSATLMATHSEASHNEICAGVAAELKTRFQQEWVVYAVRVPLAEVATARRMLSPRHVLRLARKRSVVAPSPNHTASDQVRIILLRYLAGQQSREQFLPQESNFSTDFQSRDVAALVHMLNEERSGTRSSEANGAVTREWKESMFTTYPLKLDYDDFGHDDVLRQLLPASIPVPKAFEATGHVLHLNLRDVHHPYKYLIGQVLREKIPGIRVVVNKAANVGGVFRTFEMEVLAAVPGCSLETCVRENGCVFHVDMSRVYWNSRLETEHRRVIDAIRTLHGSTQTGLDADPRDVSRIDERKQMIFADGSEPLRDSSKLPLVTPPVAAGPNAVPHTAASMRLSSGQKPVLVADAFAGIGPFAVPLAKHGFIVYANDINPDAVEYLDRNIRENRIPPGRCTACCMDARAFLKKLLHSDRLPIQHIIMNLPAEAIHFLDALVGSIAPANPLPYIYCYCFAHGENAYEGIVDQINEVFDAALQRNSGKAAEEVNPTRHAGTDAAPIDRHSKRPRVDSFQLDPDRDQLRVRCVRHVAPEKYMYCVEFRLPESLARPNGSESA